jgi:enoyl-CoA hydratase/long-chain 3-hydroxyacyl-CoA dehydrogenase
MLLSPAARKALFAPQARQALACRLSQQAFSTVGTGRATNALISRGILTLDGPLAISTPRAPSTASSSGNAFSTAAAINDSSPTTKPTASKHDDAATPSPFISTPERKYKFFQNVEITPTGVAIIRFDNPDKKVNTLSFALMHEAKSMWQNEVHSNTNVKSVVFTSAKESGFIAGADIFDISSIDDKSTLVPIIEEALQFFLHMKSKNVPMVAAIHGPALGGGLEWALWCDYRICTDSSSTKLGLPEVKLGLLPGFGGTQNLPALVGIQGGMDMMLTGKDIRPVKAKKMGLVDLVVAPQSLESVAISTAEGLANGSIMKSKPKAKSFLNRFIEDTPPGQYLMWDKVKKMVDKNTDGNYPAPYAIIDCVKYGLAHPNGLDKYKHERERFAKLAATKESEALIGIFDGMNQMKKHSSSAEPIPVKRVAVMGAGLMGAGIAQVTAEKGYEVLLKDRDDVSLGRGLSLMNENWQKKVNRQSMTQYQYNLNTARVTPLSDQTESWKRHFGGADLVIEAVFENLELKRNIIQLVESVTPDHCVFATNTSAIPIAAIAAPGEEVKRPENIVGMHYFSPVPSMPLLEIIPHAGTSEEALATAFAVGNKQGKTCVVVKDVPGFYVNRCLGPVLVETCALVKEGVPLEKLDKAMKKFGMPVGPITLIDEVGVDVASKVASFLSKADLGVRMNGGDITLMSNMVEKGWLGKKSKKGFFTYTGKKDKAIGSEMVSYLKEFTGGAVSNMSEEDIQNRIASRLVNEAAKCLEDGIIENPVDGDIGLVFGIGFAPFKGGPFRYMDSVGVAAFVDRMNGFASNLGEQFEPCQLLKDYAASGKKFHG